MKSNLKPSAHASDPVAGFGARLPAYVLRFEQALDRCLPAADSDPARLHEAMRYACTGGKRLRALLVYASAEVLNLPPERVDAAACAVELIHAYSLVHDDLPCMDDDDLRRGRPTVHRAYDEATAVLVGDALHAAAFGVLADNVALDAEPRVRMLARLAAAVGSLGMVGGQAVDMASEGQAVALPQLESLHARKTGALLCVCCELAALAADAPAARLGALQHYGRCLGLAYQVQDDVLDLTVATESLGKTAGKDLAQHKSTFPALLGLEAARARAAELFEEAREALNVFGDDAAPLRWLADYIEARKF